MSVSTENKETYDFLHSGFTHTVRDPLWTAIGYDTLCATLIRSSPFMKLQGIRQLGPAALLYPGATHTRYSHSLGVMHLARRVLMQLLQHKHCPTIPLAQAKAFIAAALLHDLGHFPYTHSLKELPLPPHEKISAALISGNAHFLYDKQTNTEAHRQCKAFVETSPLPTLLARGGVEPAYTAAIVANTAQADCEDTHGLLPLFRSILSGALDPDKLDYLCRDAFFCGVPYGIQDVDFAIRSIGIDEKKRLHLRSFMPTEHVLFSKYLMYKSVYWHSTMRAATAMVKHALFHAIEQAAITSDELLFLADEEFNTLCKGRTTACSKLILVEKVQHGALHARLASYDLTRKMLALENLKVRSECERRLSRRFGVEDIIIDLPERIAFESPYEYAGEQQTNAQEQTTQKTAPHSKTVFDQHTATHFSTALRHLRVFVPQHLVAEGFMKKLNSEKKVHDEIRKMLEGA